MPSAASVFLSSLIGVTPSTAKASGVGPTEGLPFAKGATPGPSSFAALAALATAFAHNGTSIGNTPVGQDQAAMGDTGNKAATASTDGAASLISVNGLSAPTLVALNHNAIAGTSAGPLTGASLGPLDQTIAPPHSLDIVSFDSSTTIARPDAPNLTIAADGSTPIPDGLVPNLLGPTTLVPLKGQALPRAADAGVATGTLANDADAATSVIEAGNNRAQSLPMTTAVPNVGAQLDIFGSQSATDVLVLTQTSAPPATPSVSGTLSSDGLKIALTEPVTAINHPAPEFRAPTLAPTNINPAFGVVTPQSPPPPSDGTPATDGGEPVARGATDPNASAGTVRADAIRTALAEVGVVAPLPRPSSTDKELTPTANEPSGLGLSNRATRAATPAVPATPNQGNGQAATPATPATPALENSQASAKPFLAEAPSSSATLDGTTSLASHATAGSGAPPATQNAPPLPVVVMRAMPHPDGGALSADQLGLTIARQLRQGTSRFEIRLDPPELGRIHVRLEVTHEGRVSATLTTDRAETFDLLNRDARALHRALTDAGLDTDSRSLSFAMRDDAERHAQNRASADEDGALGASDDAANQTKTTEVYIVSVEPGRLDLRI